MDIRTTRLELKPIEEIDLPDLVLLLTDETVKKTYMVPDFADDAAALAMARRIAQLSRDPQRYVAGIFLQGRLIGMLNETDRQENRIELGYALLPQHHNRGYTTEALKGAIAFLFEQGFSTVTAGAFETNTASIRVMAKSGMVLQPNTDRIEYRGVTHRCVYYAISKA